MIGTVLSGYQIIEKIKDGSVGTVWKGRNGLNQDAAIKVISPRNAADSKRLREFRHEGEVIRGLEHPRIIKILGFVDARPQPYLIMEYFDSENLKFAMWYMPERVAGHEFDILRLTCEGIHFLHLQNVLHLDLKPENVLVAAGGDVRLIDFSIALTRWNRLLGFGKKAYGGTPLYMPPEQIRGEKVTPASDQYAFGAMTFELFTKKPPFLGTSQNSILEKHLKQPPPALRTFVRDIPAEVERFVLRMLAKDPKDRLPDMAAVGSELSRLAQKYGTGWLPRPAAPAADPEERPVVIPPPAVDPMPTAPAAPASAPPAHRKKDALPVPPAPAKGPPAPTAPAEDLDRQLNMRLEEEHQRRKSRKSGTRRMKRQVPGAPARDASGDLGFSLVPAQAPTEAPPAPAREEARAGTPSAAGIPPRPAEPPTHRKATPAGPPAAAGKDLVPPKPPAKADPGPPKPPAQADPGPPKPPAKEDDVNFSLIG